MDPTHGGTIDEPAKENFIRAHINGGELSTEDVDNGNLSQMVWVARVKRQIEITSTTVKQGIRPDPEA